MKEKTEKAFQFVDQHRDEMVALWKKIVSIESGPNDKVGVGRVADVLQKSLADEGAICRLHEFEKAGSMLIAEIGSDRSLPGVVFLGHMDTACPTGAVAERPFKIEDGIAYGPGVLDMKGGLVIALYAMKALNSIGYDLRPLKAIFAGDEEVLHAHSNAPDLFIQEAQGAAAAFNLETGFKDDGIVVGRKGVARFMLEVHGIAAHAGNDPENGRNAILEMAYKIIKVQNLTDPVKKISFNVGVIEGGTTSTTVPDYTKIYIDVRYREPGDLTFITDQLEKIADEVRVQGTTSTVTFMEGIKPMKTTEEVKKLFEVVKQTCLEQGFGQPYAKSVGGASDSAYSVLAGVPTVCAMGVKGGRNHSPEEHAIVETLFERTKVLVACILNLNS